MSFRSDLFFILNKSSKIKLFKIQLLIIITAFLELSTLFSIVPFINILVESNLIYENKYLNLIYNFFEFKSADNFIIFSGLMTVSLFTFSTLLILYSKYSIFKFNQYFLAYLGNFFFKKYLNMNYSFYIKESPSIIIRNLHDDLNRLIFGIVQPLMYMFARLILIFFIGISLLIYNFKITIILFLILILSYLLIFKFLKLSVSKFGIQLSIYYASKIKLINETFFSIKDILISSKQNYFISSYKDIVYGIARANTIVNLTSMGPKYLVDLLSFGFIFGLIYVLKISHNNSLELILSTIAFLVFASYKLLPAFQEIYSCSIQIKNNRNVLVNIKNMFADTLSAQPPVSNKNIKIKNSIIFKGLNFKYEQRSNTKIFDDANFDIMIGKQTAIIGPTGVGKSTLIEIILGLHSFDVDHILVDGKNFNKNNLNSLWNQISYVPQNPLLIDDTILSNICFAEKINKINYKKLNLSLKISHLDQFIDTLPNKLNTTVGEKGLQLSGGQQQRISIARALYQDKNFIFLDESMSALDKKTEKQILESIKTLKNKTILMITHRMVSTKSCDNVFIIKNKKIIKKKSN